MVVKDTHCWSSWTSTLVDDMGEAKEQLLYIIIELCLLSSPWISAENLNVHPRRRGWPLVGEGERCQVAADTFGSTTVLAHTVQRLPAVSGEGKLFAKSDRAAVAPNPRVPQIPLQTRWGDIPHSEMAADQWQHMHIRAKESWQEVPLEVDLN